MAEHVVAEHRHVDRVDADRRAGSTAPPSPARGWSPCNLPRGVEREVVLRAVERQAPRKRPDRLDHLGEEAPHPHRARRRSPDRRAAPTLPAPDRLAARSSSASSERPVAHRMGDEIDVLGTRLGDEVLEEAEEVAAAQAHHRFVADVGEGAAARRPRIEDRSAFEVEVVRDLGGPLGGVGEGYVEAVDEDEDLVRPGGRRASNRMSANISASLIVASLVMTKWRSGFSDHSSLISDGASTSPGLWMRGTVTSTMP